jgi:hypothetical protein
MKYLEIRDRGTYVGAYAFKINPKNIPSIKIVRRAGFGPQKPYIMLGRLDSNLCTYSPYEHNSPRTMKVAHLYIIREWDSIKSGDIIDIEFILGETDKPKESDNGK